MAFLASRAGISQVRLMARGLLLFVQVLMFLSNKILLMFLCQRNFVMLLSCILNHNPDYPKDARVYVLEVSFEDKILTLAS